MKHSITHKNAVKIYSL